MTGRAPAVVAAVAAALLLSSSARATTITIVNKDSAGVGFNDPSPRTPVGGNNGTTLGAQRLNVFKFAADFWAARVNSPVEIIVFASFKALACSSTSATLGQAGTHYVFSDFAGAPRPATWYPSALANKLAGQDLAPADATETGQDINATFTTALDDGSCSIGLRFYYGLDGQPSAGTIDFTYTIIHELAHGLGFQTFVDRSTGEKFAGDDGVGLDDAFMLNLYDGTTGKAWPQMTNAERLASVTNTSNLLWNGSAVKAVASSVLTAGVGLGGRPQMYAPNPSEPGSSISHWDTALFPNEIMEPILRTGAQVIVTDDLLADIGWGLSSGDSSYSWILPSSAHSPGAGGAFYTTSLSIGNRGSAEAKYKLKFLGNNADGSTGPESAQLVLGGNQSVTYDDVLASVFAQGNGAYGAIKVSANVTTLNVLGQTSTPDPSKPGGTFGQSVPAFATSDMISSGNIRSIVGIREDGSFRTNLILTNAGSSQVKVTGTLLSASGSILGSGDWTLPPLGMIQVTKVVRDLGVTANVSGAQLLLTTSTSGGSFAAYASVIDNVTNDPRTLLPK